MAADFVAIYVAEQYRRLTATEGRYLGNRHEWDDAVTQVTLLAAFHGGQSPGNRKMYYEGKFTDKVYNQNACLYKNSDEMEKRENSKMRGVKLHDYWQFTVRSECPGRSGVNLTRRDFEKLGQAISYNIDKINGNSISVFNLSNKDERNVIKTATEELLDGDDLGDLAIGSDQLLDELVDLIISIRRNADEITNRIVAYEAIKENRF